MGLFYNAQFLCFAHSKTPRFGHGVINTTCNFCVSHTAKKTHVFGMGSSLQRTISVFRAQQKTHALGMGSWLYLMPGSVLLSHGETPHYHRRYGVSLLSSAWVQVGPPRYGRQANSVSVNPHTNNACDASQPNLGTTLKISLNSKHLRCCKVKPHGSLVLVSSIHRCTYTPSLSTS